MYLPKTYTVLYISHPVNHEVLFLQSLFPQKKFLLIFTEITRIQKWIVSFKKYFIWVIFLSKNLFSTGDQHIRETCVSEPRRSDQPVTVHRIHSFQGINLDSIGIYILQRLQMWISGKTINWIVCLMKVKTPVTSRSSVLAPGLPGHQAPVRGASQGSEKRKKDSKEVGHGLLWRQFIKHILIEYLWTLYKN